jgi:hypothetical protein
LAGGCNRKTWRAVHTHTHEQLQLHEIYDDNQMKWHARRIKYRRSHDKCIQNFIWKAWRKKFTPRPKHGWNNIKMDLKDMLCVDWVHLTLTTGGKPFKPGNEPRAPQTAGNFLEAEPVLAP